MGGGYRNRQTDRQRQRQSKDKEKERGRERLDDLSFYNNPAGPFSAAAAIPIIIAKTIIMKNPHWQHLSSSSGIELLSRQLVPDPPTSGHALSFLFPHFSPVYSLHLSSFLFMFCSLFSLVIPSLLCLYRFLNVFLLLLFLIIFHFLFLLIKKKKICT